MPSNSCSMRTHCPGRNAIGTPLSTRKVRSRTSGESGTESTSVASRKHNGDFSVADAAELIGLKILLIRISQEAVNERFR